MPVSTLRFSRQDCNRPPSLQGMFGLVGTGHNVPHNLHGSYQLFLSCCVNVFSYSVGQHKTHLHLLVGWLACSALHLAVALGPATLAQPL